MKKLKLISFLGLLVGITSVAFLNSCSEDDDPAAPTISVSVTGLTDGVVIGDIGTEVVVSITTAAEGGFESLTITEYQGTTEIGSENFTTEQTSYSHTITDADFKNPFRVEFTITDGKGQTASENVIIQVEATNLNKLLAYSWLFQSQIWSDDAEVGGDGSENIQECEMDNTQTFFADGTMKYNFGASNGTNGCEGSTGGCTGSCGGDGSANYTKWEYDESADILTVYRANATTGDAQDTLVYTMQSFPDTEFVGRIDYDLSALFGFPFILTLDETWKAVPKEEE